MACRYTIVTVKNDAAGNVDFADLKAKAELHKDKLAALMVRPSHARTHNPTPSAPVIVCTRRTCRTQSSFVFSGARSTTKEREERKGMVAWSGS